MRVVDIGSVIENFLKSEEYKAILINGKWGIGKTYSVQKYLNNNTNVLKLLNYKVAYSSLFGKKDLDEVNTELYKLFHPDSKVLTTISKVVRLLSVGVSIAGNINGLPISFNANTTGNTSSEKKLTKKKNTNYLIVLDDFERKNPDISAEDLLGYINNLINQGFKVLVLADLEASGGQINKCYEIGYENNSSEEIKDKQYIARINWNEDILGIYKEKIFDRIYKISDTPTDVMHTILGENKFYSDDKFINEFSNNLRLVIKTKCLFNDVIAYIDSIDKVKDVDKDAILKICAYIVIETMTSKYSKLFEQDCKKDDFLKCMSKTIATKIIHFDDKLSEHYELINAIAEYYECCNYQPLKDYLLPQKQDIFVCLFYLSDENKEKVAKEQYDYIMNLDNNSNISYSAINQFIREWYSYCYFSDLSFINKGKLFRKLHSLDIHLDLFGEENKRFIKFIKDYNKYREGQRIKDIEKLLNGNFEDVKQVLFSLKTNIATDELKSKLVKLLKEKNFFFKNINGEISDEQDWRINHSICSAISQDLPEAKDDLYKYLINIKNTFANDNSCAHRVESLIKQYDLKEKETK